MDRAYRTGGTLGSVNHNGPPRERDHMRMFIALLYVRCTMGTHRFADDGDSVRGWVVVEHLFRIFIEKYIFQVCSICFLHFKGGGSLDIAAEGCIFDIMRLRYYRALRFMV